MLLCSVLGRLTVRSWVSLPLLFVGSTVGVAAVLDLVVGRAHVLHQDLTVSAPLLFGFAAALTLLSGDQVRWTFRWQRRGLRFPYPLLLAACALTADGVRLPVPAALVVGVVALALLTLLLVRGHRDPVECP
ncbi:hypothetical protein [Saccharopolyspora rosea]|uniref:Uncharacterized protein n=1 Tax=Saccharopolyspora rosea TaxID=524884 RepID=A0ABW3G3Y8_9PSEU|nr:hypothetical protein [Saccharopolyspora rosea]